MKSTEYAKFVLRYNVKFTAEKNGIININVVLE